MAASNQTSEEKPKFVVPSFMPNCLFLSSPLLRNPFPRHEILIKTNSIPPNVILRELQSAVTSTADKCLSFFHLVVSQNLIFKNILSFPSHFKQRFSQIPYRSYGNVNSLSKHNFAAILPGDSVAGVVVANGILNFLSIYNTLLVVRLVLTWFPNTPPAIVTPLSTLCDPYLNIFRGIIPPLGGTLDLSPILAFLVLNAFTSTAAALPAELPVQEGAVTNHPSDTGLSNLTTTQEKWMRRLTGNRSKSAPPDA